MKRCPIGIGNCSIYNLYIFLAFIFHLCEDYLLSLEDIKDNFKNNLFGFSPVLKKHKIVRLLYKYFGFIIFGTLFYFIQNPKVIKIINNNNQMKGRDQALTAIFTSKTNMPNQSDNKIKYFKELLIIGFIYSLQALTRKMLTIFRFGKFDLWIFNIIFIFVFMKKTFRINIYKHQKYSMIFNFVSNFILLIWANLIESYESIKENNENKKNGKINGFYYSKEVIGSDYFFYGGFFIFIYIIFVILSIANSYTKVLSKKLMDLKYQSHYKIIIIIGIFGLFFTTLILLFTSIFKCDDNIKKLCKINDHLDSIYEYFLNIKNQYKKNKNLFFMEIFLVIPLYAFITFIQFTFEYLVIFYLNPYYILISDCTYFFTQQIFKIIFQNNKNEKYFYFNFTSDVLAFLSYFIYLEIIELRFCELNKDIRKNIIKRQYSLGDNFLDSNLEIEDYFIDNPDSQNNHNNNANNLFDVDSSIELE